MERLQAVHGAEHVRPENRLRAIHKFIDEQLIFQQLRGRDHLAAAAQLISGVLHHFETPAVAEKREPQRLHVERHGLQAAVDHQGAGHARVVFEVRREEPGIGRDGEFGLQVAALPCPAREVEF